VVYFIMPGPKAADPRRVAYRLLNTLLGGSFTSRLNQNLREQHGYTYGARSRYMMEPRAGYFVASSSIRADVTGAAIGEFLREFKRLRDGDVSKEEAGKASETLRTDAVQTFQGLNGILATAGELIVADMPFETLAADLKAMGGVSAADLNKLSRAAVPLENGVLVLVGDKRQIMEQIKSLDLPKPIERTVAGEPVKP
jgi:predicted Zn-dependent peptidase